MSEEIWLVTLLDYDLGYFDHETCRLESLENPFGAEVMNPASDPAAALAKPLASAPQIAL